MPSIFIETSIVSYLRSEPNFHMVTATRQLVTRKWWDSERKSYDLYTSQLVIAEARRGSPDLAAERLGALSDIPLLDIPDDVEHIAEQLVDQAVLPEKARLDALHISTAAFHGLDYLLTWNCTYIANARIIPKINLILHELGQEPPYICTPDELLDDETEYN